MKKTIIVGIIFITFISVNVFGQSSGKENITNGDFANGTNNWVSGFYTPGVGSSSVSNGELHVNITDGGSATWNVQINQGNIKLVSGTEYTFSFDARSESSRTIEANVGMSSEPYTSYFASSPLSITEDMKTYSFKFTAKASDSTARVEFNCGFDTNDVYIDNVSLIGGSAQTTTTSVTSESINFPDENLEAALRSELDIEDRPIYNTDVCDLTSQNLAKQDIEDITGLEYFNSLTKLILSNNRLNNIGPLENLTSLKDLNIGASRLTDITPLQKLTNLTSLNLVVNDINDITPLANLTKLENLALEFNEFSDITPLENLTKVTYLKLNNNYINDITPLKNLKSLDYLNLSNNKITDVTALENCTKLTYLNLCKNPISDITALGNMTNLQTLVLNNKIIENIEPLANCTNLESLNLSLNAISDITPLENLTKLKVLFLIDNPLNDEARSVIKKLSANGTRVIW